MLWTEFTHNTHIHTHTHTSRVESVSLAVHGLICRINPKCWFTRTTLRGQGGVTQRSCVTTTFWRAQQRHTSRIGKIITVRWNIFKTAPVLALLYNVSVDKNSSFRRPSASGVPFDSNGIHASNASYLTGWVTQAV